MGEDTGVIRLSRSQRLRVVARTPDALELESTWAPGGSPPPTHWHPRQHEHFEVMEGELTVRLGGEREYRIGRPVGAQAPRES